MMALLVYLILDAHRTRLTDRESITEYARRKWAGK